MSRKPSSSSAPAFPWLTLALIGLGGLIIGAGLTYLALRPRPSAVNATALPPPSNPDPTAHRPDPALTAGQLPAQADRTLGNFYYDHQNWSQAIAHYQAAIREGNDDADIRTDLGNALRFTGQPAEALAQYVLARQMNPDHEFSLFNQGGLYLEDLHQPDRAVAIWQEYLVRFPNGRNVEAALQLIAQTQGGIAAPPPAAPGSTPAAAAPPSNATENLILQQIETARAREQQP